MMSEQRKKSFGKVWKRGINNGRKMESVHGLPGTGVSKLEGVIVEVAL